MKILHVVPSYLPATRYGGPIRSVHGLCKGLAHRGHDVHVVTTSVDGNQDSAVPLGAPVEIDGVKVWYFSSTIARRLYYSGPMVDHLQTAIKNHDLVHLHSVFLWPTLIAARIADKNRIPYILSPRGMLVRELIKNKNHLIKLLWITLFEQKTIKKAAGVHVTSELEAEEIRALGFDVAELFTVPNGIDPVDLDCGDRDQQFKLPGRYGLYLGRINWKKGLEQLIRSWKQVHDIDLVIAGNDEENYQPVLENLARSEGVAARIHFIGRVNDAGKWPLYKNAAFFVLPSLSENFGNVVLEALSMACPVIVTPAVGLADVVSRVNAGIVVENQPVKLAAAINQLAGNPEQAAVMGLNGRKEILSNFSWDSIAGSMENCYRTVLNQKH